MSRDTSNDPDSEGSTGVEERLDRLESLVETQQETIQQQRERITELEGETDSDETPLLANRRTALKAGGLAALLFGGVGTASADPQGQVGTSSHPLKKLYTEELNGGITGDTALTDMTGTGLQIASGALGLDSNSVGSTELVSDSVTIAGNSVSLGESTGINHGDLNNVTTGDHHTRPSAGNALADNSGTFDVQEGNISHDNIADVSSGDHHTRPSAGSGLTGTDTFDVNTDATLTVSSDQVGVASGGIGTTEIDSSAVTGTEVDLSTVAGDNITADTTNDELDADGSVTVAGNSVSLGGSTGINHSDLNNVSTGDHHTAHEHPGDRAAESNVDLDGNNLETSSGGLTVTTNDNGNLTLDPGSGNELVLNNQSTASSGSLLALDGSGNVVEADSTTLGDVGGGGSSSELVTSGNGDTAFQVVDSGSNVDNAESDIDAPNVVGGHPDNNTTYGPTGAFIGGGGASSNANTVSANYTTIGGGYSNRASVLASTIGGGRFNTASGLASTVGGGELNTASGDEATVGGGQRNTASGGEATVPGGRRGAATNNNSFVWNDDTEYHSIPSGSDGLNSATAVSGETATGANTFSVSATGGVRFITGGSAVTYIDGGSTGWSQTSTRSAKTNIDPVDPEAILDGVTEMEVATWEYKDDDGEGAGTRHVGPMAEDFHEVVDVGTSDDHINSINADGVALAAIQGLSKTLDETQADLEAKATRIADQQETIDDLESEVERKDDRIDALEAENADLRERVAAIESELGLDATADRQGVADD